MRINKKKLVVRILLSCIIGTFVPLVCTMFTVAWFVSNKSADDQAIDGEVGLRDYFYIGDGYMGDGTQLYPHEIVTPTHFYNLTRLQNLGVFPEKTWFRIGHVFSDDPDAGPKCLLPDGTTRTSVLDMTSYCATYGALLPIGNEGTPFYGNFDGQYVPVVGLKVAGNPEDVGVFGYTAHSSDVKNLIFKDLEVSSLGYAKSGESNFLYSETIKRIFDDNAKNFERARLDFITSFTGDAQESDDPSDDNYRVHNLKTTETYALEDLGSNLRTETVTDPDDQFYTHKIVKAEFVPNFDDIHIEGHDIEYSISSSTGVIALEKGTNNLKIDLSRLPNEFNTNSPVKMNSAISLVASVKIAGIKYSRVIQSYSVEIKYAPISETNPTMVLTLKVRCDHILDEEDGNHPINFSHGNNIGYVVGHADGNVEHCYVYDGSLLFNPDNAGLQKIESQTETGLIGKIGNNVTTDIDPTSTSTTSGETGVLNFSYIYSLIRSTFVNTDKTYAGYYDTYDTAAERVQGNPRSFVAYAREIWDEEQGKYVYDEDGDENFTNKGTEASSFGLYKEYLRTNNADKDTVSHPTLYYLSSAGGQGDIVNEQSLGKNYTVGTTHDSVMDSVDFAWNKVICDGLDGNTKRGLGVFRIVTAYSSLPSNPNIQSEIWRNDIGDFAITNDANNPKKAIYFSTAECDWTKGLGGWNDNNFRPAIMNTLPTYSDTGSFEYPFSRDFNYLFKLDLNEADKFKKGFEIYNYMYDTDNPFLKNYLQSKLIDRTGQPVAPTNKGFGFKVQFSQDSLTPVTELSSYITIGQPKQSQLKQYTVNGETKWYPPKSIAFSIDNPKGANVSIAGCGGDISIYSYDPDDKTKPITELYTMFSRDNTNAGYGRFFEYSSNGTTSTTATVIEPQGSDMTRTNFLYGHIFKLPRGNYIIGSSIKDGQNSARVYYVCVQGQTNGDLGDLEVATIGNYISDVDFLLKDPTVTQLNLEDESFFAKFSFNGYFTNDIGKIVVDAYEDPTLHDIYVRTRFNDFCTFLLFYCRKNEPKFKLNNDDPISGSATYDGPFNSYTDWNS